MQVNPIFTCVRSECKYSNAQFLLLSFIVLSFALLLERPQLMLIQCDQM